MESQSCTYRLMLLVFGIFLNTTVLFGQNCNQNNVSVKRFELRDQNGNPFTSADNYQLGDLVTGKLYVVLNGSTSENAFSTRAFFNIFINGVQVDGRRNACLSDRVKLPFGSAIFVIDLSWKWGDKIDVNNLLLRWSTNSNTECSSISESGSNAQCFSSPDNITAEIPVVPSIDFAAETCNPTVNFSNGTMGGKPPYTYLWNFDGFGTSTETNPTFTFPGIDTYNVSLSATDADGITNTITKPVTIPAITIDIEATPTRHNESTGSILVEPSGGTGPYTVEWVNTDPGGNSGLVTGVDASYLIENLPFGTYEIYVTDSQGCNGFAETFIDMATILFNRWGSLEISMDEHLQSVILDWNTDSEGDPGEFLIHRADNADLDFFQIGKVKSKGFSEDPIFYSHTDTDLPAKGGRVYYRINYIVNNEVDVHSELVSIKIPAGEIEVKFKTYPNPTFGENLTLHITGYRELLDKEITLSLSSSNYFISEKVIVKSSHIDIQNLIRPFPKGIIILHLKGDGINHSLKVLKK